MKNMSGYKTEKKGVKKVVDQNEERLQMLLQMRRKGIKQRHIAVQLQVSCSSISQYFSGSKAISEDKIEKLKSIIASA